MVFKSGTRCPPGVLCLTPGVLTFLILVAVIVLGAILLVNKNPVTPAEESYSRPPPSPPPSPHPPIQIVAGGGDDRYTRAPEPRRFWASPPEGPPRGGIPPFGFATQGFPDKYQSFGFIKTSEGQTLPLYGRRTAGRSDRYNYYTRTDTYNPIPIPIRYKNRDCQDSIGCDELFNGESVRTVDGKGGEVQLYQFDGPAYFPGSV